MKFDMKNYWSEQSKTCLDYDKKGYAAICYTGMPLWFNKFIDYYQKKAVIRALSKMPIRNSNILDVGCGVGRWTNFFSSKAKNVTGIDIDEIRLTYAKNNYNKQNIFFQQMSIDKINFPDESFDIINSVTVLQHLPYKEKFDAIKELARVNKKNGYLLVVELSDLFDDVKHVYPLSERQWIRAFEDEGYVLIKKNGYEYIFILRIIRYLRYIMTGKKATSRKNRLVHLNLVSNFILKIVIVISYPLENFCTLFLPSTWARHTVLVMKKTK